MIVKIRDKLYSSEDEPIMLVLADTDKQLISDMGAQKIYCRFPEGTKQEEVVKFMDVRKKLEKPVDDSYDWISNYR